MKNIILCGFMGSGKTSAGAGLAKRLSRSFVDMDDYIEAEQGMSIPDIFETFGEEYFRRCERDTAARLAGMSGLVVASGGGALTPPENAAAFRKTGIIIFLDLSFDDCYNRIKKSDRPLVKKNGRERLEQLYAERAAVYRRAADIEINAAGTPAEIVSAIAAAIGG